jgi:tRNA(Ile)-lysidine synthase
MKRMQSQLQERVWEQISRRKLLRPRQRVLVAVSGGADSMVLLHLLGGLAAEQKWELTVGHLNHRLRGRSSDADERLVRSTAVKLGLPVVVGQAEVKNIARDAGVSVEMAARMARHDFFAWTARRFEIPTVALAHHADDQLELFFLRLLRGTGVQGLAGMRWANPSPAEKRVELVRPLLGETKQELLACAREHRLKYREDATNASLDIARNRVRHELLPLLTTRYQPALRERIVQLMDIFRAESQLVGQLVEEWLSGAGLFAKRSFEDLPIALQRRILHAQLVAMGFGADFDLLERLRRRPDTTISIAGALVHRNRAGKISTAEPGHSEFSGASVALALDGNSGQIDFGGAKFSWRLQSRAGLTGLKHVTGNELFDADRIGKRVILRHWQPGDRFQPIGMDRALKLQDLFVNQKVPREKRRRVVVATTGNGDIFWVEGLRIGDPFKLTNETRRRLRWEWRRG